MTVTMPESPAAPPPPPPKRPRHGHEAAPSLPDEVITEHILTRVPAADAIRFRAVCRNWHTALTSDHFVRAHQTVRAAGAKPPEIVFFAPGAAASSTAFYSSRLYNSTTPHNDGSSPALASELVTVSDLRASDLVMSTSCHGLTLLFQPGEFAYHVINLSTGEHVTLPPCAWANRAIPYGPYVLSSTGLGFHPAANEHKVVRLFEDGRTKRPRCEVYGLRSGGGWRPIAGKEVPRHAAKGLTGRPPVFVDGCFYWHMNTSFNFAGMEEEIFQTPEPILSLSVDTERFEWVDPPTRYEFLLAELDGHLCAVVDIRGFVERQYELWVRTPASWSLRCRISFGSLLPRPMRDAMGRAIRMLPIGSSGGKILLATSRHEVYAYDPEKNSVDRVFSMQEFVDAPREPELLLNIAMHEETVAGVGRRPVAGGDVGKLKVKLGRSSVATRADRQDGHHFTVTQQRAHRMFTAARLLYSNFNMHQ